ncbi:unnamed protein product [Lathyrus oleraceus]
MVLSCELVLLRMMRHDLEKVKLCASRYGDIAVISALRFGIRCVVLAPPFPQPLVVNSAVGVLNLMCVGILGIGTPLQSIMRGLWAFRPVHFPLGASINPHTPPAVGLCPNKSPGPISC